MFIKLSLELDFRCFIKYKTEYIIKKLSLSAILIKKLIKIKHRLDFIRLIV